MRKARWVNIGLKDTNKFIINGCRVLSQKVFNLGDHS